MEHFFKCPHCGHLVPQDKWDEIDGECWQCFGQSVERLVARINAAGPGDLDKVYRDGMARYGVDVSADIADDGHPYGNIEPCFEMD
jgi:hypothetical protein